MIRNIKLKFKSKEKDLPFIPSNFEDLKNLFIDLFDEKITQELIFTYFDGNDECYIDSDGYNIFLDYIKKDENTLTVFVTYEGNNLNNYFSDISADSEYPEEEENIEKNKCFTFGDSKEIEVNFNGGETPEPTYKTDENSKIYTNIVENPYNKDYNIKQLEENLIKKDERIKELEKRITELENDNKILKENNKKEILLGNFLLF